VCNSLGNLTKLTSFQTCVFRCLLFLFCFCKMMVGIGIGEDGISDEYRGWGSDIVHNVVCSVVHGSHIHIFYCWSTSFTFSLGNATQSPWN
jgi:hypothetical protein